MKYEELKPLTKAQLDAALNSGDGVIIATALIRAALHDPDRTYVGSLVVKFIGHSDSRVRASSAIAAGHLARLHRQLSPELVPLIKALLRDGETCGQAQDALDDIVTFIGGNAAS